MLKGGLLLVMLGASVIVLLAVAMVVLGPAPGQGGAILLLVPPSLLLIAFGLVVGVRQLPERRNWQRTRDIVVLSCGGAVGASVVLCVLFLMMR